MSARAPASSRYIGVSRGGNNMGGDENDSGCMDSVWVMGRPSGPNSSQGPSRQEWQQPSGKCLTRPRMRPTAHRLNAPRVLASMVSLAGRQEARTSAKVPRANQTRCVGQPRIRARALTLGNLGGQVHKEPGRHKRLSTGYSGPRGGCVPAWFGRVARQGRGVRLRSA